MRKPVSFSALPNFDMAATLKTDADIANYLAVVLSENDTSEFTHALGVAARARSLNAIAALMQK